MKGLEFSYTLTEEEVFDGLRLSGVYKTSGKRAVIESVLLGIFAVVFLGTFLWRQQLLDLVIGLVSLGLLAAVLIVPRLDMKKQAKLAQPHVRVRLYEDHLVANGGVEDQTIPLREGVNTRLVKDRTLVTLAVKKGGMLIVPVRAIPQELRGKAMSLLLQNEKN